MILSGGDSFSKFNTPLGLEHDKDVYETGLSAVELLIKKFNTPGTCVGWRGAGLDATIAKAIHYIINHNDVKFLFFYLTVNIRIMYATKTCDNYNYADKDYYDPDFFIEDDIVNVHYNEKGHTVQGYDYFLHQPTYKKYYDRYAYLNFLTNVCKNRGINILYIRTSGSELDTKLFLDNTDNTRIIDIDLPTDMDLNIDTRHSNHLFPHEQKAFSEKILNLHESFILESLQK